MKNKHIILAVILAVVVAVMGLTVKPETAFSVAFDEGGPGGGGGTGGTGGTGGVSPSTCKWQDVSGKGDYGQKCINWLRNTNQLGDGYRVLKADGTPLPNQCIYISKYSFGSNYNVIDYGDKSDGNWAPEGGPAGNFVIYGPIDNPESDVDRSGIGAKTQYCKSTLPTLPSKPAAPTLKGTYDEGEEAVNLSWNGVANADNYEIFRAVKVSADNLGEFQLLARVGSGVTSYVNDRLGNFKGGMRYKVRALNAGGSSDSNTITVEIVPQTGGGGPPVFVPPVCSVSNPTPSAWYPVTFAASGLQTSLYTYKWTGVQSGDIGCLATELRQGVSGITCTTAPLTVDLSEGSYKVNVYQGDTDILKQTVNCPAVDVRMPRLKAEVISR